MSTYSLAEIKKLLPGKWQVKDKNTIYDISANKMKMSSPYALIMKDTPYNLIWNDKFEQWQIKGAFWTSDFIENIDSNELTIVEKDTETFYAPGHEFTKISFIRIG